MNPNQAMNNDLLTRTIRVRLKQMDAPFRIPRNNPHGVLSATHGEILEIAACICDCRQLQVVIPSREVPLSRRSQGLTNYQSKAAAQDIVDSLKDTNALGFIFLDITTGAGKTAIMAKVIADLCMKKQNPKSPSKTTAKVVTISKSETTKYFKGGNRTY